MPNPNMTSFPFLFFHSRNGNDQPTPRVFSYPYVAAPPSPSPSPGVETMRHIFAGFRIQETPRATHPGLLGTPYGSTNRGPDGSAGGVEVCCCRQRGAVPSANYYYNMSAAARATLADDAILDLMVDQHGHRDFINFVEAGNSGRLYQIVDVLARIERGKLVQVAKDDIGVRSFMSLVEKVKIRPGLWSPIASAIGDRGAFELMKHTVGSRLIRHCLDHLKYEDTQFVFNAASMFCVRLAKHITGSESLKCCIDKARLPIQRKIITTLANDCYILSTDRYGNYVIKYVIEKYGDRFYLRDQYYVSEIICLKLVSSLNELSRHAKASYVMQSCLQSSGGINLLRELARMDIDTLEEISRDPYGNYVLQTALDTNMDTAYHVWLVHSLSQLPKELLAHRYARNVIKCVRNFL